MSLPFASHSTGASAVSTVDNTLGAILVGSLLAMSLWGVGCAQTFDYMMDNTDGRLQRWIVAFLWSLDTLHSAWVSHMIYFHLVTNNTNAFATGSAWTLDYLVLVAGFSNLIIRIMFARRIYQFGRKNIIVSAWIVTVSICDLVFAALTATTSGSSPVLSPKMLQKLNTFIYISTAFGVTADLSVTIALCWLLHSAKSGFSRSDSLVNALMVYVVSTGSLVTIFSILTLVTYFTMPENLVFTAFSFMVNKLYYNAYLTSLNARERLRTNSDSRIPLSGLDMPSSRRKDTRGLVLASNPKRATHEPNPPMEISFQTTVERITDDDRNEVKDPTPSIV